VNHNILKIISLLLMVIITIIYPFLVSDIFSQHVNVGPLIFKALSNGRNCINIMLRDANLIIDGKRVSGLLIISFGGEFHTISLKDLARKGSFSICFSKGFENEYERMRRIYSSINISFRPEGVIGVSGKEVIKRLTEREIIGVGMPTLSLSLWLYDEDDHNYIFTQTFSSLHYYISKGYRDAFERIFQDPLAIVREGVTIIIPSLNDLKNDLVRINIQPVVDKIRRELGLLNKSFEITSAPSIINSYIDPDGYIYNYWDFPYDPPKFWIDRVVINTPGITSNDLWQIFISLYGSAYLFSKNKFSTPDQVRDYINSRGLCLREGVHNMDFIVGTCLNPGSYTISWRHTIEPGPFIFYKPYVLSVISGLQTLPPIEVLLMYASGFAGYNIHGLVFMGTLISGQQLYYTYMNMAVVSIVNDEWNNGVRHATIVVPTNMTSYGDVLVLKYDIRSYDDNYWIAIPIPSITPYYLEAAERGDWGTNCYDAYGACIGSCKYITNIFNAISDLMGAIKVKEYLLNSTTYDSLPPITPTLIDSSSASYVYGGSSMASIMFGIFMWAVNLLFEGEFSNSAVNKLFSFLGNFIGFADETFQGSISLLKLYWARTGLDGQSIPVSVEKYTAQNLADAYVQNNKAPLVVRYVIIVGNVGGPPGAT